MQGGIVPSLLDRLVPDLGSGGVAVRAHGAKAATTGLHRDEAAYVESVERDILWLFNTNALLGAEPPEVLRRFPRAGSSVLAYGLRHLFESVVPNLPLLQRKVESAIGHFEPRLKVESTRFKLANDGHLVEIELKGILRAESGRRRLNIRTDLQTLSSELENSEREAAGHPASHYNAK